MSSGRVEKRSARYPKKSSTERNEQLASEIDSSGYEVMPCSWCFDHGLECKMIERTRRCSECVRRGRSCDGTGVPVGVLSRVTAEQKRLERKEIEEEEAFEDLLQRQQRIQDEIREATARLIRLRKQRRFL
ncbi:uncharacterized protein E0L32_012438, partial [Thyridium curvatum]